MTGTGTSTGAEQRLACPRTGFSIRITQDAQTRGSGELGWSGWIITVVRVLSRSGTKLGISLRTRGRTRYSPD